MKRKDECLICSSRSCHERVVAIEDSKIYDEVACLSHIKELHHDSDIKCPGVMKNFISSSGKLKRDK